MILDIHRFSDRGRTKLDWLESQHSFSFGDYYNPKQMNFGKLLVLNDDLIQPGRGFGMHPHDNMEIITVMLEGTLEHKDSMGNIGIIQVGEVQRMSAGTGIVHSEFNHSKTEKVHLLQLWIEPKELDIKPSYEQKKFTLQKNKIITLVSGERSKNHLYLHQNAKISRGIFKSKEKIDYQPLKSNGTYIFMIRGKIKINNELLQAGDAIALTGNMEIITIEPVDILILDVPVH